MVAAFPLWWRAQDVFAEMERERRASALYSQGLSLHLRGRSREAAPLFRQAIILAPLSVAINVLYYLAIGMGVSLLSSKLIQARAWMQKPR